MTRNTAPWRRVLDDPEPRLREGRGGILGPDTSRRTRWWEVALDCGHHTERIVRYAPRADGRTRRGGTQHRSLDDVLPAPRRVRCEFCPDQRKRDPMATGITPGLALSCESCDAVTPDRDPRDFDDCPNCGSDTTVRVDVTACPDPSGECDDETHHFGIGMHVSEVS
jgi:predicted RNA-binding Zn-ribbon protein involved in translation (DUF1610 family)